jgi:hypothetical protein
MRDDKAKKIGSAMYLNKSNGLYIPFNVQMLGKNCTLIQPMLDQADHWIIFTDN